MSYTTLANIQTRISGAELIRLTDESDVGAIDEAKVNAAIEAAGAEIDSYVGSRYPLPLAVVPGVIGSMAIDIAIYTLYVLDDAGGIPDSRQKRYDQAVKVLTEIEAGDRSLEVATSSASSTGVVEFEASDRVFSRDKLRGW